MAYGKSDRRLTTQILTKDQLASIGSVVVESTFCEEVVELIIWGLLGIKEPQGKFLTGPLQMNSRLELLHSLGKASLRSAAKKLAFTDLVSRLKEVNNGRNVIVHGSWQPDAGVSLRRVLKQGPEPYAPAIVKKYRLNSAPITASAAASEVTAVKIAALTWELMHMAREWELQEMRKASRRKSS